MQTLKFADTVAQQRSYFETDATKSIDFRRDNLQKLKRILRDHEIELHRAIEADFNKSYFETFLAEFARLSIDIEHTIRNLKKWSRKRRAPTNIINFPATSYLVPEPLGVCLIIGTWNFPYQISLSPLVSCIAAGNTAIVKPSELASNTSSAMARIINDAFPPEYIHVIEGGVDETSVLLEQRFDKIFFTGSTRVGRIVYRAAAEHLTPVTLELGGKGPAIVNDDCNLEQSVKRLVWAKYLNAGQVCIAPDYVLVHESIRDAFLSSAKKSIEQYSYSLENGNYVQIINESNFKRLVNLIDYDKVYCGGKTDAEFRYIEPTIMINVSPDDPVMQEEIFGPIMPVLSFSSVDEAVNIVRRYPKPLALYVFACSSQFKKHILDKLSFGTGAINDAVMQTTNPYLPFGGVGESGMGSAHGKAGFDSFSHYKSILAKPFWLDSNLRYSPYSERKLKVVKWIAGWGRRR